MRDTDLDDLFAKARHAAPLPSVDLMARILRDAEAAMPPPAPIRSAPIRPARLPRRSWVLVLFGGGGVLAGLATATVAGVWIGMQQPAPVAEALWRGDAAAQLDSMDLAPGYELFASLDMPVEG